MRASISSLDFLISLPGDLDWGFGSLNVRVLLGLPGKASIAELELDMGF